MSRPSKRLLEPSQEALHAYQSKRNFALTLKPAEGGHSAQLSFVVQKHWTSSLDYEFRLELAPASARCCWV